MSAQGSTSWLRICGSIVTEHIAQLTSRDLRHQLTDLTSAISGKRTQEGIVLDEVGCGVSIRSDVDSLQTRKHVRG